MEKESTKKTTKKGSQQGGWAGSCSSAHQAALPLAVTCNCPPPPIPHTHIESAATVCLSRLRFPFHLLEAFKTAIYLCIFDQRSTAFLHLFASLTALQPTVTASLFDTHDIPAAPTVPGMADAPIRQHPLDPPWLNPHRSCACGLDARHRLAE
ncbi:hypothetical protein G3M48_001490 [Beauveria asiatica]|uniref:Uncharacterized protein n=1 Tax=Beauveria asiatica TaxID=1069075 RepID=A0AAW0RZ87_9HYPO